MKLLLSFLISIALVSAGSFTLVEGSSTIMSLELNKNSANSSNMDVAFVADLPDAFPTLPNRSNYTVICFDAGNENYTIALSTGNLPTFGIKFSCPSTNTACTTISQVNTHFEARGTTSGSKDSDGRLDTGAMTEFAQTFTATQEDSTNVARRSAEGLTPANMVSNGLPNTTTTGYYSCYADLGSDHATDLAGGVSNVWGDYQTTNNVTILGSNSARVGAVVALAGSLAASFIF